MKAAELIVRCLENERVEHIFGLPGRFRREREVDGKA